MYGISHGQDGSSISDLNDRDRKEFLLVLIALLPLQVIYPTLSKSPAAHLMMILFFSVILVAGLWIMRGSRQRFLLTAILTLVSLELMWISLWPAAASLLILGEFCLLLVLIMLTGRNISMFIRTCLSVPDLLMAGASLLLLTGTVIGLSLNLVAALSPDAGSYDLAWSLRAGIALLTTNGNMIDIPGSNMPLSGVISILGMIGGVLLICLIIGKIGVSIFTCKDVDSD
jgi:membrane-associated HD superfamily phosphohydrolase